MANLAGQAAAPLCGASLALSGGSYSGIEKGAGNLPLFISFPKTIISLFSQNKKGPSPFFNDISVFEQVMDLLRHLLRIKLRRLKRIRKAEIS